MIPFGSAWNGVGWWGERVCVWLSFAEAPAALGLPMLWSSSRFLTPATEFSSSESQSFFVCWKELPEHFISSLHFLKEAKKGNRLKRGDRKRIMEESNLRVMQMLKLILVNQFQQCPWTSCFCGVCIIYKLTTEMYISGTFWQMMLF